MTRVNNGTKMADSMIWRWEHCNKGRTVEDAYRTRPSAAKISSYNDILSRCLETEGYNGDIKVVSASNFVYTTMYSVTNSEGTFLIMDTKADTYILKVA